MDLAQTDIKDVIAEFVSLRIGPQAEHPLLRDADCDLFTDIVRGVVRRQREIDPLIDRQLAEGWRLIRIDSIVRAILRAGVFELIERTDVPIKVVITEYINVAHAFFAGDEPRLVNGVLDKLARQARPGELT